MGNALVIGAGGFIGHNLVGRLKRDGWRVKGVDRKNPQFEKSPADEFEVVDARSWKLDHEYDRVYQLAAEMGGAGYVFTGKNDADILSSSLETNLNILRQMERAGRGTIFYSSSVCAYPAGVSGKEADAYPANPPSNYGWEKLTSERLYLAYAGNKDVDVRIARFHNCFGPNGTFDGGREKAPAAVCRKIAQASDHGEIEIWGDGKQLRPFIFIEDLLDGIEALMRSNFSGPINLGPRESVTIDSLVDTVSAIAGKTLTKKYLAGPTGEQERHADNTLAREKLGWEPKWPIEVALRLTYRWVEDQLAAKMASV